MEEKRWIVKGVFSARVCDNGLELVLEYDQGEQGAIEDLKSEIAQRVRLVSSQTAADVPGSTPAIRARRRRVRTLYESEKSDREIAHALKVGLRTVSSDKKALGLTRARRE